MHIHPLTNSKRTMNKTPPNQPAAPAGDKALPRTNKQKGRSYTKPMKRNAQRGKGT